MGINDEPSGEGGGEEEECGERNGWATYGIQPRTSPLDTIVPWTLQRGKNHANARYKRKKLKEPIESRARREPRRLSETKDIAVKSSDHGGTVPEGEPLTA